MHSRLSISEIKILSLSCAGAGVVGTTVGVGDVMGGVGVADSTESSVPLQAVANRKSRANTKTESEILRQGTNQIEH